MLSGIASVALWWAAAAGPELVQVEPAGDSVGGEQVGYDLVVDSFALIDNEEQLGPGLVEIHLWSTMDEESGEGAKVLRLPEGKEFDPAAVYRSRDGRTALVGIAEAGKLSAYWAFDPRTGEDYGQIDEAALERIDRVAQLTEAAPASLRNRVRHAKPLAEWMTLIHPMHRYEIEQWGLHVRRVNAYIAELTDADLKAELPTVEALIAEASAIVEASELVGAWRCRSLQGTEYGLFVYRDFRCEIRAEADGKLWLQKIDGSQRRSGYLYPHGNEPQWVFLGGATVNEDPEVPYSRIVDPQTGVIEESDSYGLLMAKSSKELVLVLDVDPTSYEIYQLRR